MSSLDHTFGLDSANIDSLFDAVPDAMLLTDVEGVIVRASRSAGHLLGYPVEQLEGLRLNELVCVELRSDCEAHRTGFLDSGESIGPELETLVVAAGGRIIPIDASVGKLEIGVTTCLVLVMREVSDRLATQRRLELMVGIDELTTGISSRLNTPDSDDIDEAVSVSIQALARFCDADAAYLLTDNPPGCLTVNTHAERAHGENDGRRGAVVEIGLDSLPWLTTLLESTAITMVNVDAPPSEGARQDCRQLRDHGLSSLVLIPLRASGRTIGLVGIESSDPARAPWPGDDLSGLIVLQDVFENALERKRIGSELLRVNRVLQAVSECHDTLIRAEDEKGLLRDVCRIVVEAGGYALAWVGYAMNDEGKRILPQAQWGDDQGYVDGLQPSWGDAGAGRRPAGTSIRTRRPFLVEDTTADDTDKWLTRPLEYGFRSLVTVPVLYDDEVAGVLAVYDRQPGAFNAEALRVLQRFADDLAYGIAAMRARARQREAEAQLRDLLKSKDDFIATIAHELRTPLAGVVGFAQVLRDDCGSLDAESRAEMIRLVAEQGIDLTNIVDDLLVAAKSEAGTLEVARVRVDLRAQAAQVLEAWGSEVTKGIRFTGEPAASIGDPARIRQILRNLVANALRYGGEAIAVRVGSERGTVYARVEDDGSGVAPDEIARIFEPYRRAHDAPGVTASMGLGLSISRHLAELMGGSLGYHREPDLSVFTLAMPTLEPDNGEG